LSIITRVVAPPTKTQRLGQKHLAVKTPEVRRIGAENNFFPSVSSCWMAVDGVALGNVRLVRYADDMVLLAQAWEQLQVQFAALQLVVNQEKSRLTTLAAGFALLGFEFRKAPGRMLLRGPRHKACRNVRQRVREAVRSIPYGFGASTSAPGAPPRNDGGNRRAGCGKTARPVR
jgi:hypothetical protein